MQRRVRCKAHLSLHYLFDVPVTHCHCRFGVCDAALQIVSDMTRCEAEAGPRPASVETCDAGPCPTLCVVSLARFSMCTTWNGCLHLLLVCGGNEPCPVTRCLRVCWLRFLTPYVDCRAGTGKPTPLGRRAHLLALVEATRCVWLSVGRLCTLW